LVAVTGPFAMLRALRDRQEWKFFAILPRADRTLAFVWWTALILRGVAALPTTLDLSAADFLPEVDGSVDANTRPTVTWSTAAPIAGALALFEVRMGIAQWNLIAPAVPGAVRYPDLPADLWTAATPILFGVADFESPDVTSYAANNLATLLFTLPAAGHQVRISTQQAGSSARVTPTARALQSSWLPSRW